LKDSSMTQPTGLMFAAILSDLRSPKDFSSWRTIRKRAWGINFITGEDNEGDPILIEMEMEMEGWEEIVKRGIVIGWEEGDEGSEFEIFINDNDIRLYNLFSLFPLIISFISDFFV
jgi:hypothetical protein